MALTWDFASAADIAEYYGGRVYDTMRAVVVKLDGKPVVIIGLAREPERDRLFSDHKPEIADRLKSITVMRALKQVMKWVESSRVPIYAMSEGSGILEKLGFEQVAGDFYQWPS